MFSSWSSELLRIGCLAFYELSDKHIASRSRILPLLFMFYLWRWRTSKWIRSARIWMRSEFDRWREVTTKANSKAYTWSEVGDEIGGYRIWSRSACDRSSEARSKFNVSELQNIPGGMEANAKASKDHRESGRCSVEMHPRVESKGETEAHSLMRFSTRALTQFWRG